MRCLLHFILGIFLCSSVLAPAQEIVDINKLTKKQKSHLLVYKQIDALIRAKKIDHEKFFFATYEPIVEAARNHKDMNLRTANQLQARVNRLLEENKINAASRMEYGAKLFLELANINNETVKMYEKKEIAKVQEAVKKYISVEQQMIKNKIKPPEREWFTSDEAARIIARLELK
jgi:hypothetical protein